jgi:2-iminobutanoate/2-iminopropanoate deaminase
MEARVSHPPPESGAQRMPGMVDCVEAAGLLFFSAIRGRRPLDDSFDAGIEAQTRQAFSNLRSSLRARGLDLTAVVKVTVFLSDLELRAGFHAVWCELFPSDPPARTVVHVDDANPAPGGAALFVLDVVAATTDTNDERHTR